jgi:hypothetical protein
MDFASEKLCNRILLNCEYNKTYIKINGAVFTRRKHDCKLNYPYPNESQFGSAPERS